MCIAGYHRAGCNFCKREKKLVLGKQKINRCVFYGYCDVLLSPKP